jgi:hypothetical protein|tara:strand:- start:561 stop:767 length:207 start_codon:yes stop_codon:yes gene_type:complete
MKFTTSYEETIFNTATHFVAVRRVAGIKTRAEFKALNEAKEYGTSFGDNRTMVYAVNELGSSAHICNA